MIFNPVMNLEPATPKIYGAEWDGSSTTAWTRTDAAVGFADPQPAVSNGTGSSPFDDIMPWKGMVRVTNAEAGEVVAIPKFYYKWTQNGNALKLQISEGKQDGFYTSPAHVDRGDGKGERDVVYVGRYHCASNWKSVTGVTPKVAPSYSEVVAGCKSLGDSIYESDLFMRQTIQMLYLVEFADWDSQAKIGYGGGSGGNRGTMGYTDSMTYHTGTTLSSRSTPGFGTQYRNIEGLWDNVYDYINGCRCDDDAKLYVSLTPMNITNSSGAGTLVAYVAKAFPTRMGIAEALSVQWLVPAASGGTNSTYVTDSINYYLSSYAGGTYLGSTSQGIFSVFTTNDTYLQAFVGGRLMILP